uniref:Uncharacterized protein n=1 Tax=Rhizophora mucronata TaxID=61149 RepID=A0A2P2NLR1_RHIMU
MLPLKHISQIIPPPLNSRCKCSYTTNRFPSQLWMLL